MDKIHDQNDTRLITFVVDEDGVDRIDKKLELLRESDPGFYVQVIDMGSKCLYRITTRQKNLEHAAAKKFLFQLELQFGSKLNIR